MASSSLSSLGRVGGLIALAVALAGGLLAGTVVVKGRMDAAQRKRLEARSVVRAAAAALAEQPAHEACAALKAALPAVESLAMSLDCKAATPRQAKARAVDQARWRELHLALGQETDRRLDAQAERTSKWLLQLGVPEAQILGEPAAGLREELLAAVRLRAKLSRSVSDALRLQAERQVGCGDAAALQPSVTLEICQGELLRAETRVETAARALARP